MKYFLVRSVLFASAVVLAPNFAPSLPAKETALPGNGDLDLARRLESAFEKVAEHASESVVVITAARKARVSNDEGDESPNQFDGTPFEFFFRRHGLPAPEREPDSQGSGIVFRKDGYILTNHHVVDGAGTITVRFKDGTEMGATLVGSDERTDVAVIKVEGTNLRAAQVGDSEKVKVGQWAIAIGAPFELEYSFTVGFVSAKGRPPMDGRTIATIDYIQTDASINPGNSGGPLCDIEGRVIGINTLIRGLNRGIGFAIPINMARDVADQLIEKGRITRPWLGIQIESLSDNKELAGTIKDLKDGVVVRAIYPDTPAAKSDLKPADVIVAVDGAPVKSPRDLQRQVLNRDVGVKLTLNVIRDGKPMKIVLQTGELPDQPQRVSRERPGPPRVESGFGLTVQTLDRDLAKRLEIADTEGVVVTEVADGSAAQEKGLQRGDVITEVDRQPVRTAEEFTKALRAGDSKKGVLLYVKRDGASTFVVLKDK
jgi:Do/DeqQ family serine protease